MAREHDPAMKLAHLVVVPFFAALASAQTTFVESEPNSTKSEATPVLGMRSGDKVAGTSTSNDTTLGSGAITTVDTFLIKTAPHPPGIYANFLQGSNKGFVCSLRGLNQTGTPGSGGTPGSLDVPVQTAGTSFGTTGPVWYGFGKEEQVYVRMHGPGGTPGYSLTLNVVAQFVDWIDGSFAAGPVTISTVGLTTHDTDLVLLDGNFDPVPGGTNDDEFPVASRQSRLTRSLAPGVYYLGIAHLDVVSSIVAPSDEGFPTGRLVDFPGSVAGTSADYTVSFPFTISDGTTTATHSTSHLHDFGIRWFRFTVGDYPATPFCFGDGSSTPCPCGPGGVGHGCPNSADPLGGRLASSGTASLSADDLVLLGSNMPSTSTALYIQSTGDVANVVGDGILCAASGTILRLGVATSQSGNSQFPATGGTAVSVVGQISGSPATRYYQVAYRDPPAFCASGTFNYTNALRIVWGP
jgi:hypothetical protein